MTLHWLSAPRHCGRAMVWNTWRACWMCANPRCNATA